jgi:hypothetical protein
MDFKPQTIYIIAALVAAAGLVQAVIAYRAIVGKTDKSGKIVTLSKGPTIALMVTMGVAICFFVWIILKGRGTFKGLKLT